MTQPSHHLACHNCNNWAHSCVCGTQGNELYMAPITYHHQPLSSLPLSNCDEPPSCSNIASGVGSSSSPISPTQSYLNPSPFINITPPTANTQSTSNQPSSSNNQKRKSTNNTSSLSSSKRKRTNKENFSLSQNSESSASVASISTPIITVPGIGPSSRPVDSSHIEHPAFYKTTRAQHEIWSSTSSATNKSTASDVWWFVQPYDTNEKPSEPLPPVPDSYRSKTRHKGNYIGCLLCPWSVPLLKYIH